MRACGTRLRTDLGGSMISYILGGAVSTALVIYLFYALIRAEKF
ncbi:K(+)-transporting ATPase subunit F [Thalassospira xiamenensis]|nr:K(+)-transporting ATPase subunit F [Thalassospira xiamenensis]